MAVIKTINSKVKAKQYSAADIPAPFPIVSRVLALYDAIVGSIGQVDAGAATHSSIQAAINYVGNGGNILVLDGNYSGNILLSNQVTLIGQGYKTIINGTFEFQSGSSFSLVKNLLFNGNITIDSPVTGCFFTENWLSNTSTLTDNGSGNIWTYITL